MHFKHYENPYSGLAQYVNCAAANSGADAGMYDASSEIYKLSTSPFFQNLLKRNKHPHPLIYMRGVRSEDLLALVDFLYFGKANVCQDYLESFLAIA